MHCSCCSVRCCTLGLEVQGVSLEVHASDEDEVQSEDEWEEVEVDDSILPEVRVCRIGASSWHTCTVSAD